MISEIKDRLGFQQVDIKENYPDEISIKVSREDFRRTCWRLHEFLDSPVMMLFAEDERGKSGGFVIRCVFLSVKYKKWILAGIDVPADHPGFDSLAKDIHSAGLFEREIWEMFGLEPKGHPDLRRLRLHDEVWPQGNYPLRKDFKKMQAGALREYPLSRVDGAGVFEIPVGPVHAGIIGPGHFHFSVAGEPIINLEIRLGFTHRGVEKILEGRACPEAVRFSECVSGDASFAHSLAFVRAAEKIAKISVPRQADYLRGIFLELERMYNHVNDMGGIALDVGFSFPAAFASIIKEAILRLNENLSGSRYLKGVNLVGGVSQNVPEEKRKFILESLKGIKKDFSELVKILYSSVSFLDRVDATGILRKKTARDLGVIGLAGRASGVHLDLRECFPGGYQEAGFRMMTRESGDILARLQLRVVEFEESSRLVEEFAKRLVAGEAVNVLPRPAAAGSALGYAEGWRGPVLYWLKTDERGLIERCKIVDASFSNWQGLSYSVLGEIVPDFPVCNKSFDLSYPGNDL